MNERICLDSMILFVEEEENEFWMGARGNVDHITTRGMIVVKTHRIGSGPIGRIK